MRGDDMSKGTKTKEVRAVGYVRVSTEQQTSEGVSLDAQTVSYTHLTLPTSDLV